MFKNRSTGYVVQIHKDADSPFLRAIKNIIHPMIALHQSDRPSIDGVVEKLSLLMDSPERILMIESRFEKSMWIRDNDEFQKICGMPKDCPPVNMVYCRISDGILAIGGGIFCNSDASAQCHHFSLTRRNWRRMKDLPTARCLAAVVLLGDDVLVLGGVDLGNILSACEKLNISANTWTSVSDLPEPLKDPLVTVARGKVFIIPRVYDITPGNRLQLVEYDPSHDSYSEKSQLPENVKATDCAHLVGLGDQLYLFQALEAENQTYQMYEYNLSTGQWSNIVAPDTPSLESYLGDSRSGKLMWCKFDTVYEYDRDSHRWSKLDYTLPCSHAYSGGFVTIIE